MILLIGSKGQLIKMTPVMRELDRRKIDYYSVASYQHPQMISRLAYLFNLKFPSFDICNLGKDLTSFKDLIKWFLKAVVGIIEWQFIFRPGRLLIIHGDTVSTLLGLIIGKLFRMKIAHIESGYRSYSFLHPFPEEIIRRLACKFSDILFAPSDWAVHNLRTERAQIVNTKENTIVNLLRSIVVKKKESEPYIVATIHRQETLYDINKLIKCIYAIDKASYIAPVKWVLHPLTKARLKHYHLYEDILLGAKKPAVDNIEFLDLLIYPKFINLVANSLFVISDGGGLQEETYYLNKPLLIMRKKTEKRIGLGETACLSEFNYEIVDNFIENWQSFKRKGIIKKYNPSKIIVDELKKYAKNQL